jgi:hypothetical protein
MSYIPDQCLLFEVVNLQDVFLPDGSHQTGLVLGLRKYPSQEVLHKACEICAKFNTAAFENCLARVAGLAHVTAIDKFTNYPAYALLVNENNGPSLDP